MYAGNESLFKAGRAGINNTTAQFPPRWKLCGGVQQSRFLYRFGTGLGQQNHTLNMLFISSALRRDEGFYIPLLPFPASRILPSVQILISSMFVQNLPVLLSPKSVCQPLSARTADSEVSPFPASAVAKGITH